MFRNLGRRLARKAGSILALPFLTVGTDASLPGAPGQGITPEEALDEHIDRIDEHHKNNADVQDVMLLIHELERARNLPSDNLVMRANTRLKTLDTLILGVDDQSYLRQKLEHLLKKAGKLNIQTVGRPPSPSPAHTVPSSRKPRDRKL